MFLCFLKFQNLIFNNYGSTRTTKVVGMNNQMHGHQPYEDHGKM